MSGLNWKPFVYGGLASIVAEFGKNVKTDKSALQGYRHGSIIFGKNQKKCEKKLALFVLKTTISKLSSNTFWERTTNGMANEVKKSQIQEAF